ncbi:MAG: trypsin-like peptidase domain-containing protein [Proteobacteria bacterium]|nr:trypsin-like peptidase domain-containing protein [Pseudomonadota bacterium]
MPRIPDDWINCVFYLYPSGPAAERGEAQGGTGFFVGVPYDRCPDHSAIYAVTNRHVIDDGSPVIRINTADGKYDIFEHLTARHWVPHPGGDDLALAQVALDERAHKYKFVCPEGFLSDSLIAKFDIGPGDDVVIIGRFAYAEGRTRNLPSVRFGNIAQMAIEPRRTRRQSGYFDQETFLVEAKSIPGYSGSPVFVYIPPFSVRPKKKTTRDPSQYGPWLLGVDWCHINTYEPVIDQHGQELPFKVRANSGMMGVIPAWRLIDLINMDEFREARAMEEKRLIESGKPSGLVSLDSKSPTTDENPGHREDFNRLLDAAARKRPQGDQT